MKKVFFGGSFDPPHHGHLGIAKAALASGRCDEVVWFPAASPPHKLNARRASFADRMNMVQLLIKDEPGMSVSDFENRSGLNPSYTIDVLNKLERETGIRYTLLIGADSLLSLHTWHRAKELVASTGFIIYPRAGAEVSLEKLQDIWGKQTAEKLFSSMLDGTFFEISSTEMKISMEKSDFRHNIISSAVFPAEIAAYIHEHRLYNCNDDQERNIHGSE